MSRTGRALLLLGALWFAQALPTAHPATAATSATEQQLKAVFVFNFTRFVTWPAEAFATADEPFVIGVLGNDAFAAQVEEAVRGEQLEETHPLQVRVLRGVEEIQGLRCGILYIDRTRDADFARAVALLGGNNTLTVSDMDDAAKRGAMIQLYREGNRIGLAINADAVRGAGLTINPYLLRLATPARAGK